jgi:hypothetical protein
MFMWQGDRGIAEHGNLDMDSQHPICSIILKTLRLMEEVYWT